MTRPARRFPDPKDPAGTLYVFLDEAFQPHVAVAAVLVDGTHVAQLDESVNELFEEVREMHHLNGLPTFTEFLRNGFHASADPFEVKIRFVGFLAQVLGFKSMIMFSYGTSYPGMTPLQRELLLIGALARDIVRRYRRRPRIVFVFESAGKANSHVRRAVDYSVAHIRGRVPPIHVEFGTKRDPDLLAIPDYVLHVFNTFFAASSGAREIVIAKNQERSLLAILGSVSMARSLEGDWVIRRGAPYG